MQANLPATIELSIERGAAISGTVLFDDGTPAGGLAVSLPVHKNGKWLPLQTDASVFHPKLPTDDRGIYRLSGLATGEYLVEVDLSITDTAYQILQGGGAASATGAHYSLPVYSGAAFRTSDAAPFKLKTGEERPGEDIQIPLNKLHRVSGSLVAARDGHVLNGGGVSLAYADDQSEVAKVQLTRDQPGFNFSFVPEGDYLLRASGDGDFEYEEVPNTPGYFPTSHFVPHETHSYGDAEQPLHVNANLSGVTLAVPEKPAKVQASQ